MWHATTGMFLNWSVALTTVNGTIGREFSRLLQSIGSADQTHEQIIDSSTFRFSRTSVENVLPLTSILRISPTSKTLNGAVINCTDVASTNSASTIVNIINAPQLDYGEIISRTMGS